MRLLGLLPLLGLLGGCANVHYVPGTTQTLSNTPARVGFQTVAILPVQVSRLRLRGLTHAAPTDTTAAGRQLAQQQCQQLGYQLQKALYEQLKAKQPAFGPTLWLQPPQETNQRLQSAGITYETLAAQSAPQLQRALGTSAVLRGQTLVTTLPTGLVLTAGVLVNKLGSLPTALTATTLTLQNCQDGTALWQHSFSGGKGAALLGGFTDLAATIARPVPAVFPYR